MPHNRIKQARHAYKKITSRPRKQKRAKMTRPVSTVNMGLGFPTKLIMTHKYNENVMLTSTAGALATYQFSTNNCYDPNYSGSGHGVFDFTQVKALYNYYTVIGSRITVRISHLVNTNLTATVGLYIEDDNTITPNIAYAMVEQGTSRSRMLAASQTMPAVFSKKWSAKKAFGKNVLSNTDLQGTGSSGPSNQMFYTIFAQPTDLSTTQYYEVSVLIQYIAVWRELKNIAAS